MSEFRLVIEDENLAAWMAINNSFTRPPKDTTSALKWYWNGVLIQLGRYTRLADGGEIDPFDEVVIVLDEKDKNGSPVKKSVTQGEFEREQVWINVVNAPPAGREPPMRKDNDDLYKLKIGGNWKKAWTLHKYFTPYKGGITLWPADGYAHEVRPLDPQKPVLVSHTFRFCRRNLTVTIDKNGNSDPPLDNVSEIIVRRTKDGLPDDIGQNPPQKPPPP